MQCSNTLLYHESLSLKKDRQTNILIGEPIKRSVDYTAHVTHFQACSVYLQSDTAAFPVKKIATEYTETTP